MQKKVMLFYFDLRRYIVIEQNHSAETILAILSAMHAIIESEMEALDAVLYRLQTDTAIYLLDDYKDKNIGYALIEIKNKVDSEMKKLNLPSKLYICVILNESYAGYIKTETKSFYNIFGQLMNQLDKYLYIIEQLTDEEIKESITVSQKAFQFLNVNKEKKIINKLDEKIYIL